MKKMMDTRCSVYIAVSLDGFIARQDGDIEWLNNPEYDSADKLGLDYNEFIATIDALVMGRNSFEKVLTFPDWPYENVPVIVLSSRDLEIPERLAGKVSADRGEPGEIVARLLAEGKRHLYIDGGLTIQRFLQAGLINDITVTQIPIILGAGLPLFGSIKVEIPLQLVETTSISSGFVQSRYQLAHRV